MLSVFSPMKKGIQSQFSKQGTVNQIILVVSAWIDQKEKEENITIESVVMCAKAGVRTRGWTAGRDTVEVRSVALGALPG